MRDVVIIIINVSESVFLIYSQSFICSQKWFGAAILVNIIKEVVFIDEIDAFLAERGGAKARWELSQVNELLQQMEAADCVFIGATNLLSSLDHAAFRRFDVKVKFDAPDVAALARLVGAALERLGAAPDQRDPDALKGRLARSSDIGAGDIGAVERRFGLLGLEPTIEAFVQALEADRATATRGRGRPVGF